ncbi:MAG TPA: ATP-dependent DNA helicase RecQ [Verrucomicrobiales bacterium]|nr:ATP-dependent DNA helicase RecQ [Verrucomicrobiales bacterium]
MTGATLTSLLERHFGFSSFRPGQEQVVQALIDGRSSLALFPTGAGKSLCYQLPALVREGTALVVSPLIALMKDQVEALKRHGIPAARLDSTLTSNELSQLYADMSEGRLKLLYIAPERLSNETFIGRLRRMKISLLAIDEAHCISEWGHNFRPEYLRLAAVARKLKLSPVLALTATATPEVARSIRESFGIAEADHAQTSFHRPNLNLEIIPAPAGQRRAMLTEKLRDERVLPAIVYVTLQETAESVATLLQKAGISALPYHAGLADDHRAEAQDRFMAGSCDVIVATIAFGMGIDKANIRGVFHYNLPKTLENYMQETGRAGRDGLPSVCGLYACADDRIALENFIYGDTPTVQAVRMVVDHLLRQGDQFDISRYDLSQATDVRPLVLETIITYLEMEDILAPVGSFYAGCRIQFVHSEDRIIAGHKPERQRFLRALFSSGKRGPKYLTLDLEASAASINEPRERIQKAIAWLEESGDILVQPTGLRHIFRLIEGARSRDPQHIAENLTVRFLERERRDVQRLDEVLSFAAHSGCLMQHLLHRFGEPMPQPCGHCGNCRLPRTEPLAIPQSPVPSITGDHVSAIHALHAGRLPALRTPRAMARFLCGITSPAVTRAKLTRHDSFGMLAGVPFQRVLEQTESLLGTAL